jgi:hypothetical protein
MGGVYDQGLGSRDTAVRAGDRMQQLQMVRHVVQEHRQLGKEADLLLKAGYQNRQVCLASQEFQQWEPKGSRQCPHLEFLVKAPELPG